MAKYVNKSPQRKNPDFEIPKLKKINPIELLNYYRYDVIFKYIYVKYNLLYSINELKNTWYKQIYIDHIRVFNGCL